MSEEADTVTAPLTRSLSRTSSMRFAAEVTIAGLGLLTGIFTARNLGPSLKGALSTLSYMVALAWQVAALGAGEVAVSLLGRRQVSFRAALATTITLLALTSAVIGPLVYLASTWSVLGVQDMHGGRLAAVVAVPTATFLGVLPLLAEHRHLFGWTALARVVGGITTLVVTVYLVTEQHLAVFGGMLAIAIGPAAGALVVGIALLRDGSSLRPGWDGAYARRVMRLGLPVQLGYLVVAGAARADVLMVAALRPSSDVGVYSVALTVGQVALLPAIAISATSFPRIAQLEATDAAHLIRTALRMAALTTVACAVAIGAVVPWVLPLVFGHGFRGAVGPVELLLVGSVFGAVQWLATRSCAARGHTIATVQSFGTMLGVMLVADLVLIPPWGAMGAATASLLAAVAGAVVAVRNLKFAGLTVGAAA